MVIGLVSAPFQLSQVSLIEKFADHENPDLLDFYILAFVQMRTSVSFSPLFLITYQQPQIFSINSSRKPLNTLYIHQQSFRHGIDQRFLSCTRHPFITPISQSFHKAFLQWLEKHLFLFGLVVFLLVLDFTFTFTPIEKIMVQFSILTNQPVPLSKSSSKIRILEA